MRGSQVRWLGTHLVMREKGGIPSLELPWLAGIRTDQAAAPAGQAGDRWWHARRQWLARLSGWLTSGWLSVWLSGCQRGRQRKAPAQQVDD
eukprot:scaffold78037_cov73-Phaeocystis_antarctica.AAC.4